MRQIKKVRSGKCVEQKNKKQKKKPNRVECSSSSSSSSKEPRSAESPYVYNLSKLGNVTLQACNLRLLWGFFTFQTRALDLRQVRE